MSLQLQLLRRLLGSNPMLDLLQNQRFLIAQFQVLW
jgi:hypothetical protein